MVFRYEQVIVTNMWIFFLSNMAKQIKPGLPFYLPFCGVAVKLYGGANPETAGLPRYVQRQAPCVAPPSRSAPCK